MGAELLEGFIQEGDEVFIPVLYRKPPREEAAMLDPHTELGKLTEDLP